MYEFKRGSNFARNRSGKEEERGDERIPLGLPINSMVKHTVYLALHEGDRFKEDEGLFRVLGLRV